MLPFRQSPPWGQWALLGVSGLMAISLPVWAQPPANFLGATADPVNNQITLTLSAPLEATLISPMDKGQRRLLIDIKGATLSNLNNKKQLLQSISAQLPDISQVTLDEFRGDTPVVRMMIKPHSPEVTGALMKSKGDVLILQLLKPTAMASADTTSKASKSPEQQKQPVDTSQPWTSQWIPEKLDSATEAPSASALTTAALNAKTTVHLPSQQLQQKIDEAEMLRHERNHLEGQVQNLKVLVDQQHAMIAHLKQEQSILAAREPNKEAKDHVIALQIQLKELQKSYDEMKRTLDRYRSDIDAMETRLKTTAGDKSEDFKINFPDSAASRGGLLNTLEQLTQAEVGKLMDAEKAFREGRKFEFQHDPLKAEAKYKEALKLAPQVQEYALTLGSLYINQKKYDPARAALQSALIHHPQDPQLLNELGKVALLQKENEAALRYFREAMPTGILSNYASALRRANKLDDAEAIYKLAVSLNPKDSDLQFNLGNLYLTQKRFTEAQTHFTEALRQNNDFAEAHFHLGLAYAEQGKYANALSEFQSYLNLMPDAPNKHVVVEYMDDIEKVLKAPK